MDNRRIIGFKLVHKGFIYTRSRIRNDTKNYWDCQKLRNKLCTLRIVTIGEENNVRVTQSRLYDNALDHELTKTEVVKYNLNQEKVKNPREYPFTILRIELSRFPSGVIAHLPERHDVIRSMRHGIAKGTGGLQENNNR